MKPLINYSLLLSFLLFCISCRQTEKNIQFSKSESGIFYRLLSTENLSIKPSIGDSLYLSIVCSIDSGNTIYSSFIRPTGIFYWKQKEKSEKSILNTCFGMLNEGDSAHFLIDVKQFFLEAFKTSPPDNIVPNKNLTMQVRLNKIKTVNQIKSDSLSYVKWCYEMKKIEEEMVNDFLVKNKLDAHPDSNGILVINRKIGEGSIVWSGKTIFVKYTGRFLNGKVFDDAFQNGKALEYKVGTQNQLIKGLEILVRNMRKGEKITAILPSALAFGAMGSSTGIIPPYTSVIYDFEIIN